MENETSLNHKTVPTEPTLLAAVLHCPFCGKEPFEGRTKDGRFTIKCYGCGVEMIQDRKDKVRGHWNARHDS